ncbi:MAG: hypothetical protein AAF219_02775 [Myxococcota bacterium]
MTRIESILEGNVAWSIAELLQGLDNALDEDGRPLGERRAATKSSCTVEMELKACPYTDGRLGAPMNISALRQMTPHFDTTMLRIESMQRALSVELPLASRLRCLVMDLLAAPAFFVLNRRRLVPLPTAIAVGYKLAAGFFSLTQCFRPSHRSPVEQAIRDVYANNLLRGASEVCAGPPSMIRRAAESLLTMPVDAGPVAERSRVIRATGLAAQIEIGRVWAAFDRATECELLRAVARGRLRPRTEHLASLVKQRWEQIRARDAESLNDVSPGLLGPEAHGRLSRGFESDWADVVARWHTPLVQASRSAAAGFRLSDDEAPAFARLLAAYLARRGMCFSELELLEVELRREAGLDDLGGFEPAAITLSSGGAMRWVEAILGAQLSFSNHPTNPCVSLRQLDGHTRLSLVDQDPNREVLT